MPHYGITWKSFLLSLLKPSPFAEQQLDNSIRSDEPVLNFIKFENPAYVTNPIFTQQPPIESQLRCLLSVSIERTEPFVSERTSIRMSPGWGVAYRGNLQFSELWPVGERGLGQNSGGFATCCRTPDRAYRPGRSSEREPIFSFSHLRSESAAKVVAGAAPAEL